MWKCRCKVPWRCSDDFFERLRLRRATRRLRERTHDAAAREIDLEGVVREAFGVAQQHVGRARERRRVGWLPAQRGFGLRITPGLVRDAAERKAPLLYGVAVELEPNRHGDQGERIQEPVANLQIRVV